MGNLLSLAFNAPAPPPVVPAFRLLSKEERAAVGCHGDLVVNLRFLCASPENPWNPKEPPCCYYYTLGNDWVFVDCGHGTPGGIKVDPVVELAEEETTYRKVLKTGQVYIMDKARGWWEIVVPQRQL